MTQTTRPLRADAQRNRDRIIAAATQAFAEEGENVALETIAARADVGVGTFYRHFPNREALVIAAYRQEVDALCAAAPDLLASQPADAALKAWTERFADYIAAKRSMADALCTVAAAETPLFAEAQARILSALKLLLEAGAADGTLRPDASAEDLQRVLSAIWYLPGGAQWREDVSRMLNLVLDGLRYGITPVTR
ncbi:MAG: TetR/AcrR family transcriptional regulator [Dehalococcoidia bacterium]